MLSITGLHGTYRENADNIIANGYFDSSSDRDWLGFGVYFFDGTNEYYEMALDSATQWAYKKWLDERCPLKHLCVMRSNIIFDENRLINLTLPEQMVYFDKYRQLYVTECRMRHIHYPYDDRVRLDAAVIDWICKKRKIDVVKKSDYIRFPRDKKNHIDSRISNCLILCVKNKRKCISATSIEKEGAFDV